eukprot:gene6462-7127_t
MFLIVSDMLSKTDAANWMYETSVAVPDPVQFREFLTFKYLETKGLQKSSNGSESAAVNMSRVRAEVEWKMEEDPEVTADLNIKHNNKRAIAALTVGDDAW